MKRYKELKFDGNIYTEQYKIDDILIKNGYNWFLDCEIENVRIEILHDTLVFNSGVFFNGVWYYGVFRDGEWKSGIWENGVWYNGIWRTGTFESGIIFNGKFFAGTIKSNTTIKGGNFYNINIEKGVIREDKYKAVPVDKSYVAEPTKIVDSYIAFINKFAM